jgi:predicted acyl esterase
MRRLFVAVSGRIAVSLVMVVSGTVAFATVAFGTVGLGAVGLGAVGVGTVGLGAAAANPPVAGARVRSSAATTGFHWNDLTARDGVVLKSNVIAPADGSPGGHPGVVLVASWGLNDLQYLVQAERLAEHGYVVLSYTARGFWFSGGTIGVAGPDDVTDASTAVDWLIANTTVDPRRIGILGLSYGGGISLLAAAHDKRIRAVASMSGWADMAASMTGGHTRRPQAAFFLQSVADIVGHPSAEMNEVLADYWANRNEDFRTRWADQRSAMHYLDQLNRNRPAVLITHAFGDSIFPANQMVEFYGRLSTPKRLELTPGDHATAELSGLAGLPNQAWTSVWRWFDTYLDGAEAGAEAGAGAGVALRPHGSSTLEYYPDWSQVSARSERSALGAPTGWIATGRLGGTTDPGDWSQPIRAGVDTTADAGVALLSNGLEGLTGVPPTVWLPSIFRRDAGVWLSDPYPGGLRVRGIPRLHLGLASAGPTGTVIAYLYDTDAAGFGRLVSHAPVSWVDRGGVDQGGVDRGGVAGAVDLPMQVTAFDLPAGHRLALVLDTKDPLYLDANPAGAHDSAITFRSGSWLDLPIR